MGVRNDETILDWRALQQRVQRLNGRNVKEALTPKS